MASQPIFAHTERDLLPILEELRRLEPIFHTAEFGTTNADFERMMAPGYWEVGASGRRYSRDFILQTLADAPPIDAASAGWQTSGHALLRLGPDTYLLTYTLQQAERLTRRATIWQSTPEGWQILYHQGTIVSAEEGDVPTFPVNHPNTVTPKNPSKNTCQALLRKYWQVRHRHTSQNKRLSH